MKSAWRSVLVALGLLLAPSVVWQSEPALAALPTIQRGAAEGTRGQVSSDKARKERRAKSPRRIQSAPTKRTPRTASRPAAQPTVRSATLGFDVANHGFSFPNWSDPRSAAQPTVRSATLGFDVANHGFSFPNWSDLGPGDDATISTLRRLFDDSSVCATVDVSGCSPYETATMFLNRLNSELTKGHCEGMALAAYHYFSSGRTGVSTLAVTDVIEDINYLALTQVLPNAVKQTRESRALDLTVIADRIFENLQRGGGMTIGLHESTRAHTVLPIAIEINSDSATISVYDSNTPGRPQSLILNLSTNEWSYTSNSTDGAVVDRWSGTRNLSTVELAARTSVSTSAFRQ